MAEMEEKLGAILNSPQLMQQIMQMAQTLGSTPESAPTPPEPTQQAGAFPSFDPALLQKIASFAGSSSVDSEQQALLNALCPYLSRDRVGKLERAMRAAKVARMASGFLGQGGLSLLTGR